MIKDILRCLQLAHTANLVHLDINPCSILITDETLQSEHNVVIRNFCQTSFIMKPVKKTKHVSLNQMLFMAPERLQGEVKLEEIENAKKADIFSVGVIAYILLLGSFPYRFNDKESLIKAV